MSDFDIKKKIREGLCEAEITTARFAHGRNVLTPPCEISTAKRYIAKFSDPVVRILLVAACLSLVISIIENRYAETVGVFCAIFLTTAISCAFENHAARCFSRLNAKRDKNPVKVVRRGSVCEIPRSEVVVGEIIFLSQGDEIPADGRLIVSHSMVVDESPLNGNPAVKKEVGSNPTAEPAADNEMLFRSAMVVEGDGIMRATAVGYGTKIGKINEKAHNPVYENTPVNRQLKRIASAISRVAFMVALATFLILTIKEIKNINYNEAADWIDIFKILINNFMMSVALVIMALPEGLPMSVSLALAFNMRSMMRTGVLVRNKKAGETIGVVTTVCTGKTGILTQNDMQVADIKYYGAKRDFCMGVAVNSTAFLENDGKLKGIGNPVECAMLQWMKKEGEDYVSLRGNAEIIDRIPFTSERKFMATIVETENRRYLYVKGAPEIVEKMCDIGETQEDDFKTLLDRYQRKAMHVIAFARKQIENEGISAEEIAATGGMKYVGIAAISDPVRPDVAEAVVQCRRAGVKIKVVTGEDAVSAQEVARQVGIWTDNDTPECAISGDEFAKLSDEDALHLIPKLKIISRARPVDKQRLVQLLQKLGEVVAVTGKGTNDTPALNFADVGISTESGTTVAKEASDITLTEDSFATIATAVKWGRSLYKNIRRFIVFQLTVNITAMLVVLIGAIVGTTLPLTVTQILWINLITDAFAALALISIPPSNRVLARKPRKQTTFIVSRAMMRYILSTSVAFAVILVAMLCIVDWRIDERQGEEIYRLKNLAMFFTAFVFLQFWNLLNVRAFDSRNFAFHKFFQCRGMFFAMLAILAGQVLIVEFGGAAFRTFHLNFSVWLELFLCTSLVYVIPETVRAVRRRAELKHPKGLITK